MWEHLPTELQEVVLKQLFVPDSTGFIEPRHWTCVCNHHFLRAAAARASMRWRATGRGASMLARLSRRSAKGRGLDVRVV